MDAVRKIDLQAQTVLAVLDHLIDRGRTEELAGITVLVRAARMADVRLQNMQMAGLIFVVGGAGIEDVGQLVERQLPIECRCGRLRRVAVVVFLQLTHSRMAGLVPVPVA